MSQNDVKMTLTKISEYQSGAYQQKYQYKAFQPSLINHDWELDDPQVQQLLSEADRALGELNAFSQLVPNVDFFIRMHITKEATQSSRIEGTRTDMEEALLAKQDINPEHRDDWEEVQNYIQAMNHAIGRLDAVPLSNRLLKETHAILMSGVRGETKQPGEFRQSQNWIGVSMKNAVFVPPHQDEIVELMSDLEKFIHNEELMVPHLIKVAILHYQFETIHPFLDGNGRLGRLLIVLYLTSFKLLDKPALYLSDYFERHKTQYIDNLMAVRDSNHLKQWLVFFLFGVLETANNSVQVFKEVLEIKSRIEQQVLPRFSTRRQDNAQKLMYHLYQFPVISIGKVAALLDVQQNTANALIRDFVKHGVLKEVTGKQRYRMYLFEDFIDAFTKERGNYR